MKIDAAIDLSQDISDAQDIRHALPYLLEKTPEQIPEILPHVMNLEERISQAARWVMQGIAEVGNAGQIAALIKKFPPALEIASFKVRISLEAVMDSIIKSVGQEHISQFIAPIVASVKAQSYCSSSRVVTTIHMFASRASSSEYSNLFKSLLDVLSKNGNSTARSIAVLALSYVWKKLNPSEISLLIDSFINVLLEDSAAEVRRTAAWELSHHVIEMTPDQLSKLIDPIVIALRFEWEKKRYEEEQKKEKIRYWAGLVLKHIAAERANQDLLIKPIDALKEVLKDSNEDVRDCFLRL